MSFKDLFDLVIDQIVQTSYARRYHLVNSIYTLANYFTPICSVKSLWYSGILLSLSSFHGGDVYDRPL